MNALAPAPPGALTCPACGFAAKSAPAPQTCAACHVTFTLQAGNRLDPAVQPAPFDPNAPRIKVVSNGVLLRKMGLLAPEGVSEGTLDPVTGYIPIDQQGVYWNDIFTVAVWRKVDVARLIAAAILPLPLAVLFTAVAINTTAGFLVLALPLWLGVAWMVYRATTIKVHYARVVGSARAITVRFDAPIWKRKRFHAELLRRAGLEPSEIP